MQQHRSVQWAASAAESPKIITSFLSINFPKVTQRGKKCYWCEPKKKICIKQKITWGIEAAEDVPAERVREGRVRGESLFVCLFWCTLYDTKQSKIISYAAPIIKRIIKNIDLTQLKKIRYTGTSNNTMNNTTVSEWSCGMTPLKCVSLCCSLHEHHSSSSSTSPKHFLPPETRDNAEVVDLWLGF